MSESKELKVKSFRISDETAEKIKNIASGIDGNQQQVFNKLIEAYEFQQGKAVLNDKKSEIEEFENHINILTRKFMNILEDNQNIKTLVRTEFEAELKSKNETIQDLQSQLKNSKEVKEVAVKKANDLEKENLGLNNLVKAMEETQTEEVTNLKSIIKEKDNNNNMLKMTNDTLNQQVEQMKAEIAKAEEQEKELKELKQKHNEALATSDKLKADLNDLEKEHSKTINEMVERTKLEKEKALLELEKKYQKEIQELKEQKQVEIDKYQQKYLDLVEQLEKKRIYRNNNNFDKNNPNRKQNTNKNDILSQ